ncbi:hypothetical protein A9P82_07070 [Arachidicoccus ginsenosidimutans]|uniref:1-aminocyclopropane-1-carboxylate deaminase/D-cysteine desulfhydrase n=1 Tax=Arachidicoccus sp. BS20 TaxID=1850526 RepID=UPI0007F15D3F|nr:pyridoxal-phosphate dependent enzyme [Arachidicoccus sp. BS20]ANI89070.1 hypothetical protein A9P82_07070 [Arachidicoccus sp. BS20]
MMFSTPFIQTIFNYLPTEIDVLRLDAMHDVVSGNKWFKLKYYLQEAKAKGFKTIATFGGAYSNHIVATAFAARVSGFRSIGIIRGEEPKILSHTLKNAMEYGMQLHFVSRENYRDKTSIQSQFGNVFWIAEGGFGIEGAKGAGEILDNVVLERYTHIIAAVGTGTTIAGIIKKCLPEQMVIGVSVMKSSRIISSTEDNEYAEDILSGKKNRCEAANEKNMRTKNNDDLLPQILSLLNKEEQQKNFELLHEFHFGGYAKKTNELISFINKTHDSCGLPLDFVYTAKAFYALTNLVEQEKIPLRSKILFIHTGGLQGNLSLPRGTLSFLK